MYIGGTDERALHKLAEEVLNNAFAETVTGHGNLIEITLRNDNSLIVTDNGRGIPIDLHPKFPGKSALEVIFTYTFRGNVRDRKIYQPANAALGIGAAVINALSDWLWVESVRQKELYRQSFSKGKPTSGLEKLGPANERCGTTVCFHPDPEIFKSHGIFQPSLLREFARARALLYGGVEIRLTCEAGVADSTTPVQEIFHYPNGFLENPS